MGLHRGASPVFVMAAFVRVVAMAAALAAANAAMMAGGPSGASVEEAATARIQATSRDCLLPFTGCDHGAVRMH